MNKLMSAHLKRIGKSMSGSYSFHHRMYSTPVESNGQHHYSKAFMKMCAISIATYYSMIGLHKVLDVDEHAS